jgi:tetratricopeptide (TPR) repeat protein
MFRNMTIGKKLFGSIGVPLVVALLMGTTTMISLSRVNSSLARMRGDTRKQVLDDAIKLNLSEMSSMLRAQLDTLVYLPAGRAYVASMTAASPRLAEFNERIYQKAGHEDIAGATAIYINELVPFARQLQEQAQQFSALQSDLMAQNTQAVNAVNAVEAQALWITIGMLVACLVLVGVVVLIVRRINQDLRLPAESLSMGAEPITIKRNVAACPGDRKSHLLLTIVPSKENTRPMKLTARIPVTAAFVATLLFGATGCNQLKSRDQLNKGVQAFKNARYEEAVDHFQTAIKLDPSSEDAKLYLATAYSYQVVPNLDTPENLTLAQKALDGFEAVLAKNPNDLTALEQIASIDRNIKKMDDAKLYERKVIALDPNNAEAYYTIGVVDWMQAYKGAVAILAADGLTDDGNGNVKKTKGACQKLQAANTAVVTEGLEALEKAVSINPTYEEAMTYLNLMNRRKADLECGDDAARKADLAQADEWTQKSMGARKANELKKEQKVGGGVTM